MPSPGKSEQIIACAAAFLAAAMGSAVVAAWHFHWTVVLQLAPNLVPMQYNTAFAFLFSGLALLLAQRQETRAAGLACALLVFLFSALTGMQYVFNADFGIDRLFFEPYVQTRTSHPGRMAPNTALLFMAFSAALFAAHLLKTPAMRVNVCAIICAMILLASAIVLAGYFARVEMAYSWWGMSDMAPQTAAGFALLGIGLSGHCGIARAVQADRSLARQWVPACAALAGIVVTMMIAQALLFFDKQYAGQIAGRATQRVAQLIGLELRHVLALKHARGRLNGATMEAWRAETADFMRDNPAHLSIALFDRAMRLHVAAPEGDEAFWRASPPARKQGRDIRSSGRVRMQSGAPAVLFYVPLPKPRGGGYVATAYDMDRVMPGILHIRDDKTGFGYEILDGEGRVLYSSNGASEMKSPWGITDSAGINIPGLDWRVRVTLESLARQNSGLALLVIVCGTGFSLLFANALRQADNIRRYQRQLESVMDNIVDGLVTIDGRGIVQSFNKACERIFGYAAADVIGRNVSMLMPPEHAANHDGYIENYKRTGVGRIIGVGRELEGKRRNGSLFPLELSVAEVRIGAQRIFSGIIRDISGRKAAETALRRSHDELEQFAYVASHDLKAPLRGIDNLAAWIAEDIGGSMTEETAEKFTLLRNRVKRLETLLDDILKYSRAGRITDPPEEIDVGRLLEAICLPLGAGKISIAIDAGMPVIHSHRTPLEQVFSNLVANAIKHHDRDAVNIVISAQDRGASVEFAVKDDGPGIPPEFHDRVFQMFQTLHPRDRKEGSGLGMAIVKKLVEWQGGRVWILSQKDARGTEIRFLWPKASAA